MKRRPQAKGLIVIGATAEQLLPYVEKAALDAALASACWPGTVTLLLPASRHCPVWLRGRHDRIAVRLTSFAPARKLCLRLGTALVSTSANRSGQRALRNARAVRQRFGASLRVESGKIGGARRPSQIRDWLSGQIVRK